MIFGPELCEAILLGHKTQTRRLNINYNLAQKLFALGWVGQWVGWEREIEHANELLAQNHVTLAVQPGRGKKGIGFTHILKLRRENLQDISEEDAIAEGCNPIQRTTSSVVFIPDPKLAGKVAKLMFSRLWDSIYSRKGYCWVDNPMVIVHEFELANS